MKWLGKNWPGLCPQLGKTGSCVQSMVSRLGRGWAKGSRGGLGGPGLLPMLDGVIVTGAQPERDSVSSGGGSTQIVSHCWPRTWKQLGWVCLKWEASKSALLLPLLLLLVPSQGTWWQCDRAAFCRPVVL